MSFVVVMVEISGLSKLGTVYVSVAVYSYFYTPVVDLDDGDDVVSLEESGWHDYCCCLKY